jgi:hypothetical protein
VAVQPNQPKASLTLRCAADAPVVSSLLRITGKAEIGGRALERVALCAGQKDGFARGEPIPTRFTTTLPTPFKFSAQFSFIYAPRGGILKKKYLIDRGGFDGPLEARLADRQGRHLQGVTGPVVEIPAGVTEFEYPVYLPPWMELGRTSRTNLMLTGELRDAAGTPHKVCFTTKEQNEQLIALVSPAPLRLGLDRVSYAFAPGGEISVGVELKRDATVSSPVRLELIVPRHMRDVAAVPVVVPAGSAQATLVVRFGVAPGPLNMPLLVRATTDRGGEPLVAEASLELVPPADR